jgi:F-type H+-transporting ATPase subunit epsilon
MLLEIITPDQQVYQGEVTGVQVPGSKGSFEVLDNHAPVVSTLEKGKVRINDKGKYTYITIDSGVIEVLNNKAVILAESAVKE